MRFRSAKRRETGSSQSLLKVADVVTPECEVMNEVPRARQIFRMNFLEKGSQLRFSRLQTLSQIGELVRETLQCIRREQPFAGRSITQH
jgi:hypothetical protein